MSETIRKFHVESVDRVKNEVEVKTKGGSKFLKVIHETPPNSTSNGVSATVDEGGFLRGNKDKGKVIVFTAPKGAANGR